MKEIEKTAAPKKKSVGMGDLMAELQNKIGELSYSLT